MGTKLAYVVYTRLAEQNHVDKVLPGLFFTTNQLFWLATSLRTCHHLGIKEDLEVRRPALSFRIAVSRLNLDEFQEDFACSSRDYLLHKYERKCDLF